MKTVVQSMKPLSALLPSHLRLTHKLTQNRKNAMETRGKKGGKAVRTRQ